MAELDLSFLSFLAVAFAVGFVAGFLLRGLRRRRIEDMLQFFRQRDQEQDRRISNLERDLSDARGRLLSLKADQGKGDKSSGELRAAYEEAQRTIARLREELARPLPAAEPAPPPEPAPEAAAEPAVSAPLPAAPAAPVAPAAESAAPAAAAPKAAPPKAAAPKAAGRNGGKKGRLP